MSITIRIADSGDFIHAQSIANWYQISSEERGTGIATRTVEYLQKKMNRGDAIIAFDQETTIGFCYIETFQGKKYVSNSGLIVYKDYRGRGLAKKIKHAIFHLGRDKYPDAKIFGITTSDIVMKINSSLGYRPVAFHKLTADEAFWNGCSSCPNYDILLRNDKRMCLCTGMMAASKNQIISHEKK